MAKPVVVDSSVIVKWVSSQDEARLEQADKLLKDCQSGKVELYSSELAKYETANALLKGKQLDLPQALTSLETIYHLPINFVAETDNSAGRTYALAQNQNMTYYDATFLSLAQTLKGVLITDNIKHQRPLAGIKVTPLAQYK